ncbi:MAG: polysaccharide biosynthesis/export family protein [Rikenellaceae bacterium]
MKLRTYNLLVALILIFSGCASYKNVSYIQDSHKMNEYTEKGVMYDARIMPKDLLTITVNTSDSKSAMPFNLTIPSTLNSTNNLISSQPALQEYLVDNNGYIEFPSIGMLKLGGLNRREAEELIKVKLEMYLKETPIVNVRMSNYNVSVLGEVAKPGTFKVENEKINILEALAMAGDLTIYGMRDNVKLIRENDEGRKKVVEINLNSVDFINSDFYYLKQNDVIYVTPNKTKAKNSRVSTSNTIWLSVASTAVSIITLLTVLL